MARRAPRRPGLVVVESDEDVLLYETGHIPGAVKIDWHTDLNDPVVRDYVDGEGFAALLGGKGISRDATVVIYGDKNNWWAAYALWVFSLFGHEDVRLLDGGRDKWIAEGREFTTDVPDAGRQRLPGRRARRQHAPRLQGRRARAPRQPADRRPLPRGVQRRAHHRAGLPRGGRAARRPHPDREERAVGASRRRGRQLQDPRRARRDLPRRGGPQGRRRRSSPTAASASARATPGSCCTTCSASRRSATTTARGPSGAARCACRSHKGTEPGALARRLARVVGWWA